MTVQIALYISVDWGSLNVFYELVVWRGSPTYNIWKWNNELNDEKYAKCLCVFHNTDKFIGNKK